MQPAVAWRTRTIQVFCDVNNVMRTDSVTLETCAAWATLLLAAAGGKLEFPMHASVSECACAGDTNCGAEHTGQLWQVLSTARRRSKIPFSKHRSRRQPSVQREPVRIKGDMPSESSQQSWSWEAGADVEELLISELVAAPHGESLDKAFCHRGFDLKDLDMFADM